MISLSGVQRSVHTGTRVAHRGLQGPLGSAWCFWGPPWPCDAAGRDGANLKLIGIEGARRRRNDKSQSSTTPRVCPSPSSHPRQRLTRRASVSHLSPREWVRMKREPAPLLEPSHKLAHEGRPSRILWPRGLFMLTMDHGLASESCAYLTVRMWIGD
ncbi:hypothetical protein C8Q74DRAFT_607426 [Fomes fomentarius]|nr:hypothetical protein C8Q74DRAFT_607426 [Fomes fomentarius]